MTTKQLSQKVRRAELRVIRAAKVSSAAIAKAHRGDPSNIEDENKLMQAVNALVLLQMEGKL